MKCFIDQRDSISHLRVVPSTATKSTPANIVFVIDVSGSMDQEAQVTNDDGDKVTHGWSLLDIVKHATSTVCGVLDEDDSISIVTFTDLAECVLDWTKGSEKQTILETLKEMKPLRSTNYVAGLLKGFEQFYKKLFDASQSYHIYFFTDGLPSSNFNPVRGYTHFLKDLERKLFSSNEIKINMTTIGLGNQLDSQLLSDMAPFGFIYMPDPGCIGPCMCNLVAHTKSIATCKNMALTYVKIRIQPASALKNIDDCLYTVTTTDSSADIHLGPMNYDLPRNIIIELTEYVTIQLVQGETTLEVFEKSSIYDEFHVIRTAITRELLRMHVPISTATLQEEVSKLAHQHPLAMTMNQEMLPGINDFYYTWGKHFLKALPPMLRDERRSTFRDQCLQKYCQNEQGSEDTLFEDISNCAEHIFASTPPPPPSHLQKNIQRSIPLPTQLPDEFLRGGGCWKDDCKVIVKDVNGNTSKMKTSDVKAGYMVFNGKTYSKVICVVKRNMKDIQMAKIGSLFVTPWHPIIFEQDWKFPNDCNPVLSHESSVTVFDFVLADTHIVVVENIPCITLGHNYTNGILAHAYYGSTAIIKDLKSCPGWSSGLIEFSDVEL